MKTKKSYLELTRIIAIILVIFHQIDITSLFYHDTTNMGTMVLKKIPGIKKII